MIPTHKADCRSRVGEECTRRERALDTLQKPGHHRSYALELICTTCDGLGQERREIIDPQANVAGWTPEPGYPVRWWRRTCKRCNGTGYVPSGTSVPSI